MKWWTIEGNNFVQVYEDHFIDKYAPGLVFLCETPIQIHSSLSLPPRQPARAKYNLSMGDDDHRDMVTYSTTIRGIFTKFTGVPWRCD